MWRSVCRTQVGQHGQAILWVSVMLPLFLSIVGLAVDGGLAFAARRDLQNAADAAARAGAMQIDERAYRESSGANVRLNPEDARRVASEYLAGQQPDLEVAILVESDRVEVRLASEAPTSFLRLVGIKSMRVSASAVAQLRYGIRDGAR
jgi:Flp pilus assembly protein TadG